MYKLNTRAYLFDAKGIDKELKLEEVDLERIRSNQLLWINILGREREIIEQAVGVLGIKNVPIKSILNLTDRPTVDIFENFYRFYIVSVKMNDQGHIKRVPIDFLVGKNYVITIHDEEIEYFKHFSELEKGETHIGDLDVESFIAALLDLHIVSYFCVLEDIEKKVDRLDERVLKTDIETDEFLREMVSLRKTTSKLRQWFLPHRDVFYALSRPDFQRISQSDSAEHFRMLNQHFENAVDSIESARDTVIGLFDLYATKSTQLTNRLVQRLTFTTLIIGALGVIAGIFGMNFEADDVFKFSNGFWMTVGGMLILATTVSIIAKLKRWI